MVAKINPKKINKEERRKNHLPSFFHIDEEQGVLGKCNLFLNFHYCASGGNCFPCH